MRATNLAVAGFVTALGAVALAGAIALGTGRPAQPGPGAWPAVLGGALVLLGIALGLRARATDDAERFTRAALPVLAALASMAAFVAVVGVIGFEIPALLLTFAWLRFLGDESWLLSALVSVGLVATLYLLFVAALDVTIPHMF
ncbi:putative membrane protein [Catenuloplanes nepalensis]|uniref:Membrane protein n=1 Tax=Catenuloplanes nepalensis TaxID=587533 RepID=A0ABT9MLU6_9ACTN|nr:tripartite tricarboxylate transporter TctB family protein [Catenuloplanes nepalensis]MDP9792386.1 putative membrane protein [Catenuloplanes nepalensis]